MEVYGEFPEALLIAELRNPCMKHPGVGGDGIDPPEDEGAVSLRPVTV